MKSSVLLRGGFIVDHLKNTMGYSMRTAEWRYTEWVGIMFYILFDVLLVFGCTEWASTVLILVFQLLTLLA